MLSPLFVLTILSILLAGAFAAPAEGNALAKRATCTPASLGNTQLDDTPAIKAAITSCGNGGIILIPAGTTYSLRSMLDFTGCVKCDFQLEGTLKASDNLTYWATVPAILNINGINGLTLRSITKAGVIDGNGQDAYDEFAVNSALKRQTAVLITGGSGITITGFTVKNPPNVFFSQKGGVTNVNYASLTMTAASKSTNAPKNTDGFDIGQSTFTTIKDVTVANQDDCVAFKPGCNFLTITGITCSGSHGLSVGSLGETTTDTVSNVFVSGATMINSAKAAGIKLYPGGPTHGTAIVSNVTWDSVTVQNCDYAAQIQSCYPTTSSPCPFPPSTAQLSGIVFSNWKGTTSTKESPVISNLDCPTGGTCGVTFSNYLVTSPSGGKTNLCSESISGITCTSGATG